MTPLYWRLYAHAFGLSASLQERLGEAKQSVDLALATLDRSPSRDDRARAALLALDGRIAGRQGRVDEALQFANQAEALIGAHPALDRVRGDAYGQTWRWSEAATMLARVTEKAPGDTAAWRDLARALMSTGGPRAAYDAALAGLKLQPRDEGLLRCETLALEALQSPEAATARAPFCSIAKPTKRPLRASSATSAPLGALVTGSQWSPLNSRAPVPERKDSAGCRLGNHPQSPGA